MARHLDGMADPNDPRWQDQGRPVGDGRGAPRVEPSCFAAIAIGVAAALGLTVAVGAIYLAVSP